MISINEAKRLIKRALLANLTTKKQDLAITPLVSGKHGIGKSQMVKSIARDLGGVCITIEGGTLKEGEITGLPYQYKDENGQIRFRFLPYYAVKRIQAKPPPTRRWAAMRIAMRRTIFRPRKRLTRCETERFAP